MEPLSTTLGNNSHAFCRGLNPLFAARLSKAGTESEMTEIFTGDILRFGSDVVDKSRNVTQKCVIMRVALQHPGGEDQVRRDSRSRLYRPSDSYEDLSVVTTNLQVLMM